MHRKISMRQREFHSLSYNSWKIKQGLFPLWLQSKKLGQLRKTPEKSRGAIPVPEQAWHHRDPSICHRKKARIKQKVMQSLLRRNQKLMEYVDKNHNW